jgi:hypothetical protein
MQENITEEKEEKTKMSEDWSDNIIFFPGYASRE